MLQRIKHYGAGIVVIGLCVLGLMGPIMYPELMLEAQMNGPYYMGPML